MSSRKDQAQSMIFELQDKLVEKEYMSAKLYYDLAPIRVTPCTAVPVTTIWQP